jgi:hypothetical protein
MIIIGIILVIVLLLLFRLYTMNVKEGYISAKTGDIKAVTFCPGKSAFYTNQKGEDICCDGVVNGSRCEGKKICTFGEGRNGLPNCSEIQTEYMSIVAARMCPPSMPYYYEVHGATKMRGCNSKGYKKDTYEPVEDTNHCIIYATDTENRVKENSCLNRKLLDEMECVSPNCNKFIRKDARSGLALVMQMFNVPGETAPRICMSRDSYNAVPDKTGVIPEEICDNAVKKFIEKRVL